MKIAVIFSGQLRFCKEYSEFIIKNLINLYDVDVYAHLWFSNDMLNKPFHHCFDDVYKETVEEFVSIYNPKKYIIDVSYNMCNENIYNYKSNEHDLNNLSEITIKEVIYRINSQWYSIFQSYNLIENPNEYDFIIRLRTDCYIKLPIILNNLNKNILYIQTGTCAGHDRLYCDWFAVGHNNVMKYYIKIYFYVDKYFSNGLIHMHKFMEYCVLDMPILVSNYEFNVPINHMFYKYHKNLNCLEK